MTAKLTDYRLKAAFVLKGKSHFCSMANAFTIPPWLKKGDSVAITATARAIDDHELLLFVSYLKKWDLKVKLSENIGLRQNQFAGNDHERAAAMQALLDDPEIKAVFCARGGYGTARMMRYLDWSAFQQHPKWVIGFSDVTALHALLHYQLQTASIHAPMPSVFTAEEPLSLLSIDSIRKALFGEDLVYELPTHSLNVGGNAEGILFGGNLSVLYSLRGTAWDGPLSERVFFIEDLDEYLYHVDRMMLNLSVKEDLVKCKALLCGGMSEMNDNHIPFGKTAEQIIHEHLLPFGFPMRFQIPAGHEKLNLALRFGMPVRIEANRLILSAR